MHDTTERLLSFRPAREFIALDAPNVFPTQSSFEWFVRKHRARLVESGQLIVRTGSAGNLVGPDIERVVLEILREESAKESKAARRRAA